MNEYFQNNTNGATRMAHWLKALVVLPHDQDSISRTHIAANNCPVPWESTSSSGLHRYYNPHGVHTCRKKIFLHAKYNLKKLKNQTERIIIHICMFTY